MTRRYPDTEPFAHGLLDTGDGHQIYWERCGTRGAKPAVFLHGGPGGGIAPEHRRFFDPARYDVLLFDQRGCGRSTPYACLEANTTWHLVDDIERLRDLMGVDRWLVFGGSWGSTLALAYAETYPRRVSELIVRGIYFCTQADMDWYYKFGVSELFPEQWAQFNACIPVVERGDLLTAYHRRIIGPDREQRIAATIAWSLWEGSTVTLLPDPEKTAQHADPDFAVAFAALETHYFVNRCWLEPDQLLRGATALAGIPGVIVHGRYDMPCPARNALALSKAWPDAELKIIEGTGHAASEPGIASALVAATDRFAAS